MASLPEADEALAQRRQGHLFLFAGVEIAQGRRLTRQLVAADQHRGSRVQLVGALHALADIAAIAELDGEAGAPQDREILSFDGRVLITRYVDPDAANRYGNMVYVRCGPRA